MFNDSLVDGLAWDWVNRKLYWTDAEDKDIEVIDALNGQRKLLVSMENTTIPRAIVVDPKNRYITRDKIYQTSCYHLLIFLWQ